MTAHPLRRLQDGFDGDFLPSGGEVSFSSSEAADGGPPLFPLLRRAVTVDGRSAPLVALFRLGHRPTAPFRLRRRHSRRIVDDDLSPPRAEHPSLLFASVDLDRSTRGAHRGFPFFSPTGHARRQYGKGNAEDRSSTARDRSSPFFFFLPRSSDES